MIRFILRFILLPLGVGLAIFFATITWIAEGVGGRLFGRGAIATEPQWLIESGGETQSLVLPESAVVSGATVSGPDFGP